MDCNRVAKLSWPLTCIKHPCRIWRLAILWCALAHPALPLLLCRCCCCFSSVILPPLQMLPPSSQRQMSVCWRLLFFPLLSISFFFKTPLSSILLFESYCFDLFAAPSTLKISLWPCLISVPTLWKIICSFSQFNWKTNKFTSSICFINS
jgi:hypothetical protein